MVAFAALAGEDVGVTNYAYAVFVGTGKYAIDDRDLYIFNAPLVFDLYDADSEVENEVRFRLLAPIAIGVTDFETVEDFPDLDIDSLQTLSFVPGLEMPITVNDHWQVKPFAQVGFGVDTASDSESFIWGAGVRTGGVYGEDSRWLVGGEYLWAGNNPNGDDPTTSFSRWGVGVEYKIPTNWSVFDRYVSWHLRAIQWYFTDAADFEEPVLPFKLKHSTQLGLSFGLSRPIDMLGYKFTQLGIGATPSAYMTFSMNDGIMAPSTCT